MTEQELFDRCTLAYFRSEKRRGRQPQQPSYGASDLFFHRGGTATVVLSNVNGVLAGFKVYPKSGQVVRLPLRVSSARTARTAASTRPPTSSRTR